MTKLRGPQIDTGTGPGQILAMDSSGNPPPGISGMQWKGSWVDNTTYEPNDMVRDGRWTMVALATTTERPAPQPIGEPEHAIDPTIAFNTASNSSVIRMVHNYTFTKTGWVTELKVLIPFWNLDSVSRITITNITTGDIRIINNPILDSNEWVTLAAGNIFFSTGDQAKIEFEFYNSSDANSIDGKWKSNIGTGTPATQQFNIDNVSNPTIIEIDHTDIDGSDRSTQLDNVATGSIINIVQVSDVSRNVKVQVTAIDTTSATSTKYTVAFIGSTKDIKDNKDCAITIDIPIAQPSEYGVITDYYLGTTNQPSWCTVSTELWFGSVQQADTDDAYGIDVIFQEMYFSTDWEVVSYSTNAGSSGVTTGALIDTQVFTTSGTWTKPAGARLVEILLVGGGGGGGGTKSTIGVISLGGSGGGGGAVKCQILASNLASTETVTVGTGGSGGAVNSNGASGTNSEFSSGNNLVRGSGGSGGNLGEFVNQPANSGSGGLTSVGSNIINAIRVDGGDGNDGSVWASNGVSNGDGGAVGFGLGTGGGSRTIGTGASSGNPSTGYGAGGSAAMKIGSGNDAPGSNGRSGIVIIKTYN